MTNRTIQLAGAITLAMQAHQHQLDLGLQPYMGHPLRVAGAMGTDHDAMIIALLHDVVEDSEIGLGEILGTFGNLVGSAIWALSRQGGESYPDYIQRLLRWSKAYPGGEVAVRVKLADLADNLRIDRLLLAEAHGADVARLVRKYTRAIATLEGWEWYDGVVGVAAPAKPHR
jgi:(p)ppGpp synthase/HD superfamily hydrolase